ncbi:hypothetical protein UFOVP11_49 [uncultured Caudovirales phage]|uniref:Uncharacterized protein n=1 Tax=uncultured Caudovirales phage TaxID=2100421 RepID=A0A6J5KJY4_9CAUD|nr:hypothetical protein UFOVP11_49 [uncultured Caudovirales phage]
MNQARRNSINKIVAELQNQSELLAGVIADEQEAFDNMPEGLQQSDKGQSMEDNLYSLQEQLDSLEEIISNLESMEV